MPSKRKDITYTATIESLTRLNSSVNGNPRFMIHFVDGATAKTQVDASIAYELENPENIGVPVKVTATPSGLVWDVEPIKN